MNVSYSWCGFVSILQLLPRNVIVKNFTDHLMETRLRQQPFSACKGRRDLIMVLGKLKYKICHQWLIIDIVSDSFGLSWNRSHNFIVIITNMWENGVKIKTSFQIDLKVHVSTCCSCMITLFLLHLFQMPVMDMYLHIMDLFLHLSV